MRKSSASGVFRQIANSVRSLAALWLIGLLALACGQASDQASPAPFPMPLAAFSENGAIVNIVLERDAAGDFWLAATFTPSEAGFHLYSKDTPLEGVNGLGRPTLLELTAHSKLTARGGLSESVAPLAEPLSPEQQGLRVYPDGPVTLRLPVALPQAEGDTVRDEVAVTYMVCSARGCKQPVIAKLVPVNVPTAGK